MRRRVSMAAAAAVLLVSGGAAFGQGTEIFFGLAGFEDSKVYAVMPDGSGVRLVASRGGLDITPTGLAVDAASSRLWSVDLFSRNVSSAFLFGTPTMTTVVNQSGAELRGGAVDAQGRFYFAADPASESTIRRVNADGTGLETLYTAPAAARLSGPYVDRTNGHVYFAGAGEIKRMDLDGSNVKTIAKGVGRALSVEVDVGAGYVYWLDAGAIDFVGRVKLDGSDFRVLYDYSPNTFTVDQLHDLLLDRAGGKLYFSYYYDSELNGQIRSINLDGTGSQIVYSSPQSETDILEPRSLALGAGDPADAPADCDGDGTPNDAEIAAGAPDCDADGIPDSCDATPCHASFLVDNGAAPGATGRSVGGPGDVYRYQPFDVPAGGWTLAHIGVDGYTTAYAADGSGMSVRLFPDDGTGNAPNEGAAPLATVPNFNLRFDSLNPGAWVYAPMPATLPQGRHWIRIQSNSPAQHQAAIREGATGPNSKSRAAGGDNTLQSETFPLAIRLVPGASQPACPADFDGTNGVQVADIFAFLRAWFANAPSADFDQMNGIQVADIFAFLRAWFAGC